MDRNFNTETLPDELAKKRQALALIEWEEQQAQKEVAFERAREARLATAANLKAAQENMHAHVTALAIAEMKKRKAAEDFPKNVARAIQLRKDRGQVPSKFMDYPQHSGIRNPQIAQPEGAEKIQPIRKETPPDKEEKISPPKPVTSAEPKPQAPAPSKQVVFANAKKEKRGPANIWNRGEQTERSRETDSRQKKAEILRQFQKNVPTAEKTETQEIIPADLPHEEVASAPMAEASAIESATAPQIENVALVSEAVPVSIPEPTNLVEEEQKHISGLVIGKPKRNASAATGSVAAPKEDNTDLARRAEEYRKKLLYGKSEPIASKNTQTETVAVPIAETPGETEDQWVARHRELQERHMAKFAPKQVIPEEFMRSMRSRFPEKSEEEIRDFYNLNYAEADRRADEMMKREAAREEAARTAPRTMNEWLQKFPSQGNEPKSREEWLRQSTQGEEPIEVPVPREAEGMTNVEWLNALDPNKKTIPEWAKHLEEERAKEAVQASRAEAKKEIEDELAEKLSRIPKSIPILPTAQAEVSGAAAEPMKSHEEERREMIAEFQKLFAENEKTKAEIARQEAAAAEIDAEIARYEKMLADIEAAEALETEKNVPPILVADDFDFHIPETHEVAQKEPENIPPPIQNEKMLEVVLTKTQIEKEINSILSNELPKLKDSSFDQLVLAEKVKITSDGKGGLMLNCVIDVQKKILGTMATPTSIKLGINLGATKTMGLILKGEPLIKAGFGFQGKVEKAIKPKLPALIPSITQFLTEEFGKGKSLKNVVIEGDALKLEFA